VPKGGSEQCASGWRSTWARSTWHVARIMLTSSIGSAGEGTLGFGGGDPLTGGPHKRGVPLAGGARQCAGPKWQWAGLTDVIPRVTETIIKLLKL
jgi:hypothetical protein